MSAVYNPEADTIAEIERLADPALYLGSAGAFVDRVVARVAALG